MTKAQQLAQLDNQSGAVSKVIAAATTQPSFDRQSHMADDHAVHMGIVRHLGMDFSLGSATVLLGEARRLAGLERRARIECAMRHLQDELDHGCPQ